MRDERGYELRNDGVTGKCEMGVGWEGDGPSLEVKMCGAQGTWRPEGLAPYGTIMCDHHYEKRAQ